MNCPENLREYLQTLEDAMKQWEELSDEEKTSMPPNYDITPTKAGLVFTTLVDSLYQLIKDEEVFNNADDEFMGIIRAAVNQIATMAPGIFDISSGHEYNLYYKYHVKVEPPKKRPQLPAILCGQPPSTTLHDDERVPDTSAIVQEAMDNLKYQGVPSHKFYTLDEIRSINRANLLNINIMAAEIIKLNEYTLERLQAVSDPDEREEYRGRVINAETILQDILVKTIAQPFHLTSSNTTLNALFVRMRDIIAAAKQAMAEAWEW